MPHFITKTWKACIQRCVVLIIMLLPGGCEEPLIKYVKARTPEELKTHAYETCGRHYRVIAYEDDTALIECLKPLDES